MGCEDCFILNGLCSKHMEQPGIVQSKLAEAKALRTRAENIERTLIELIEAEMHKAAYQLKELGVRYEIRRIDPSE